MMVMHVTSCKFTTSLHHISAKTRWINFYDCEHVPSRAHEPMGLSTPMLPDVRPLNFASVLVSAGTELTLFLVGGTVLCFGFSVRIMLITL